MLKYPWKVKWTSRNKLVAKYIRKGSLLDIGGGLGEILDFTKPTRYVSLDREVWSRHTIVVDLNDTREYPICEKPFDNVLCQGIIEYINDPITFLKHIKKYGGYLILTYREGDGKGYPVERQCFLNQAGMKDTIKMTGWEIEKVVDSVSKLEKVYICKRKNYDF